MQKRNLQKVRNLPRGRNLPRENLHRGTKNSSQVKSQYQWLHSVKMSKLVHYQKSLNFNYDVKALPTSGSDTGPCVVDDKGGNIQSRRAVNPRDYLYP